MTNYQTAVKVKSEYDNIEVVPRGSRLRVEPRVIRFTV
jgi:hypothetical protein